MNWAWMDLYGEDGEPDPVICKECEGDLWKGKCLNPDCGNTAYWFWCKNCRQGFFDDKTLEMDGGYYICPDCGEIITDLGNPDAVK